VTASDEEFAELEHLAQVLGVPLEELLRRSVAAYLTQVKAERAVEPIGFGMRADRPEMQDAAKWVADLRERAWTRLRPCGVATAPMSASAHATSVDP